MTQAELDEVLVKHKKWLNDEEGGERADLRDADLRRADLQGANINFCSWAIWCGSLKVHIDDEIGLQLLYHAVSPILYSKNTSKWLKRVVTGLVSTVNMFIKVKTGEVEKLEPFEK